MLGSTEFSCLKGMCPSISVGALSADLSALGRDVKMLEDTGVQMLHFDVMDGCFVPMMTFGPPVIKSVKTRMLKDVHLMIEDPITKIEEYAAAGADIITVHRESTRHIHRALQMIGAMKNANNEGKKILRGIAINPGTLVETLYPLLDEVDLITLLAVNPGWGGQQFIDSISVRIDVVHRMLSETRKNILLMVDGGINKSNAAEVIGMGADILVTGSAIFDGSDPVENVKFMLSAVRNA